MIGRLTRVFKAAADTHRFILTLRALGASEDKASALDELVRLIAGRSAVTVEELRYFVEVYVQRYGADVTWNQLVRDINEYANACAMMPQDPRQYLDLLEFGKDADHGRVETTA